MIVSKRINFESFSRDLAKEFWTFGKSIHKVIQIRKLRVHKNCKRKIGRTRQTFYVSCGTFWGKNFGREQNFYDIWAMNELLPFSWRKIFSGVFKTALHVSRQTFWDKKFFFGEKHKLDSVCWFSLENFRIFGKLFQQEVPYRNLRDQRNILNFCLKKIQH